MVWLDCTRPCKHLLHNYQAMSPSCTSSLRTTAYAMDFHCHSHRWYTVRCHPRRPRRHWSGRFHRRRSLHVGNPQQSVASAARLEHSNAHTSYQSGIHQCCMDSDRHNSRPSNKLLLDLRVACHRARTRTKQPVLQLQQKRQLLPARRESEDVRTSETRFPRVAHHCTSLALPSHLKINFTRRIREYTYPRHHSCPWDTRYRDPLHFY